MAALKVAPRQRGMPKQVVLACLKRVVAHFCPSKMANFFEKWPLLGRKVCQEGIKNVVFKKSSWTMLGAQTSEMWSWWAHFEPFWPVESPEIP